MGLIDDFKSMEQNERSEIRANLFIHLLFLGIVAFLAAGLVGFVSHGNNNKALSFVILGFVFWVISFLLTRGTKYEALGGVYRKKDFWVELIRSIHFAIIGGIIGVALSVLV